MGVEEARGRREVVVCATWVGRWGASGGVLLLLQVRVAKGRSEVVVYATWVGRWRAGVSFCC